MAVSAENTIFLNTCSLLAKKHATSTSQMSGAGAVPLWYTAVSSICISTAQ